MTSSILSARALSAPGMPAASFPWFAMGEMVQDSTGKRSASTSAALKAYNEANDLIGAIKGPLNLITILGPARTGKSTLLNCLAGSKSDLFQTSSGAMTFTKGVLITTETFTLPQFSSMDGAPRVDSDKPDLKVSFIDTEGEGAMGTAYDVNLFSPVLLCAKVVIFNWKGGFLTDQILSQLGMMTEAGRRLRGSQQGSSSGAQDEADHGATNGTSPDHPSTGNPANASPRFGHLIILFNRFQLNRSSNIDQLRSGLLNPESETDPAAIQRNQIRKVLIESFTSISVNILPDNGVKSSVIIPKTDLTGGDMADFVPRFIQAINTQEPLNVPTIFEASRNQALNLAFTKFQTDLRAQLDTYAPQPATSTFDLRRTLDTDIELVIADMINRLSYMPDDVLNETDLNVALDTFFTSVRTEYETFCTAYDPDCIPTTYKDVFEARFNSERERTKSRFARAWSAWVSAATRDAVSKLNTALEKLAASTKVGDKKAWNASTLSTVNEAKSDLNDHLNTEYLGPDMNDNQKKINDAIDDAAKIHTAAWENDAEEQKAHLDTTLDLAVGAYKSRLMAAISDTTHQPEAMAVIIPATQEKKIVEIFLENSKLDNSIARNGYMKFDLGVSNFAASYTKPYSEAMNTFDQYFDAQLNVRSKEWSEEYARTMGEIDIGNSSKGPNGIKSACQTAGAHANSKLLDLEILIGSLRENTLSAVKLESERTRLAHMVQDGENAKLRQYDELVSLYNRALLNEKVCPIIEKSMAETRYYETPTALDNDIADAQHAFKAGAREFSGVGGSSSEARRDEMWDNFYKSSHDNLYTNVITNKELPRLNGKDEMPEGLQRKIIENVKYDCAYMANDLGFSWITGTDFPGRAKDLGLKAGASAEDPRGAATRSFFLRNTGEAQGWWDDRKTNMKFFEWKLEASDYVLGKPIYSEMKPEMMLTQVFPASSNPSKFNSTASITKSGTVSDSISREHSWGAKVGTSVRAKVFGASVTASLEATYNGKYATGHVETIQNSFTVGGSSDIDLPANVS
ncbi:hypothetical protein K456DRAFT_31775 [Colletotrichum gloeosporioides 23]|nr:hypothetical protein K456DRAFT_31775 [Colletotrichum gloeosporioides 23]